MSYRHLLEESLHSALAAASDSGPGLARRTVLLAPLLAALPVAFSLRRAGASEIDPHQTTITLPEAIQWTAWSGLPANSGEMATLYGGLDKPGPYVVLMKWHPGFMSAPHSYATDRLSLVLSGT